MWERLTEASLIMVVGMGGVLVSLFFFYLVITLMNKAELFFVNWQKQKAEKQTLQAQIQAEASLTISSQDNDLEEEELTAVITAAVTVAIQKDIIIKKIKFLQQPAISTSWSTIGRMNLIGSHDVHKSNQ